MQDSILWLLLKRIRSPLWWLSFWLIGDLSSILLRPCRLGNACTALSVYRVSDAHLIINHFGIAHHFFAWHCPTLCVATSCIYHALMLLGCCPIFWATVRSYEGKIPLSTCSAAFGLGPIDGTLQVVNCNWVSSCDSLWRVFLVLGPVWHGSSRLWPHLMQQHFVEEADSPIE